jgi:hypothetical protein
VILLSDNILEYIMKKNEYMSEILAIMTIFIIIAIIALGGFNYKKIAEKFNSDKKYTLEYYYMDGCGHCIDFNKSKIWEKLEAENWENVTLKKYNRLEKMDRIERFNITGFPSIILVKNEELVEHYNGHRTFNAISAFIKSKDI